MYSGEGALCRPRRPLPHDAQADGLHDEAEAAGITAILGMGGTPGITNLLARAAVDKLDRVDSIKVQLGCSDDTPSTAPLVAPYSIRTILDEFTKQPQVFQDGAWYPQQPLTGQEEMIFPLPVGRATAIYSLHSECATFPVSFRDKGIRYVSFKIAFPSDFLTKLKFLVDLGFGSDEPINVRGVKVSPREVLAKLLEMAPVEDVEPQDCDVLRVVATGEAGGQPVEITNQVVVLPYRRWGIGAGALDTGTTTRDCRAHAGNWRNYASRRLWARNVRACRAILPRTGTV